MTSLTISTKKKAKGYVYKSDYAAILAWADDDAEKAKKVTDIIMSEKEVRGFECASVNRPPVISTGPERHTNARLLVASVNEVNIASPSTFTVHGHFGPQDTGYILNAVPAMKVKTFLSLPRVIA